jgi:hypothetical protein
MPPVEFEPTNSAGERLWTYALDRVATGTGIFASVIALSLMHSPEIKPYLYLPSAHLVPKIADYNILIF